MRIAYPGARGRSSVTGVITCGASVGCAGGFTDGARGGRNPTETRTVLTSDLTAPDEFTAPSRTTMAPTGRAALAPGAMLPIGGVANGTPTRHRPQVSPGTGAPCHTPRDTPPGTSTGVSRRNGPEGAHAPTHEDENGDARGRCVDVVTMCAHRRGGGASGDGAGCDE